MEVAYMASDKVKERQLQFRKELSSLVSHLGKILDMANTDDLSDKLVSDLLDEVMEIEEYDHNIYRFFTRFESAYYKESHDEEDDEQH